jgi:hypothetical protein
MQDRVLKPDELPFLWGLNPQEQETFVRWAEGLDWKRAKRMAAWNRGCETKRLNWQARQRQLKLFMEEE